jgi:hypothetical protein
MAKNNTILYTVFIFIIIAVVVGMYVLFYSNPLHESYTDEKTTASDIAQANSAYDLPRQVREIPNTGIIPPGSYSLQVTDTRKNGSPIKTMMAPIPPGCKLNNPLDPKSGIISDDTLVKVNCLNTITLTKENTKPINDPTPIIIDRQTIYNPNDINQVYHYNEGTPQDKEESQEVFKPVLDLVNPPPLFYESGSYIVDSTGYVPNYADSIYLSSTTGFSQIGTIENAPYMYGGFCKENSSDKQTINAKCSKLDKDVCASTECCVLLGGQKCVAGNEQGPSIPNSYSDFTIVNRDFYYYSGKCYGNCPNDYFGPMSIPGMKEDTQNAMVLKDEVMFENDLNKEFNQVVNAAAAFPTDAYKMNPTKTPPSLTWGPLPTRTQDPRKKTCEPNNCMPDGGDSCDPKDTHCTFKQGKDPDTNKDINVCSNDYGYDCKSPSCCSASPTVVPM